MIKSFGDDATEDVWNGKNSARARKLPQDVRERAEAKLDMLDAAADINDLRSPPGNHLEALSGNMDGLHSIRINDQWRITFRWTDGGAENVKIVDYH